MFRGIVAWTEIREPVCWCRCTQGETRKLEMLNFQKPSNCYPPGLRRGNFVVEGQFWDSTAITFCRSCRVDQHYLTSLLLLLKGSTTCSRTSTSRFHGLHLCVTLYSFLATPCWISQRIGAIWTGLLNDCTMSSISIIVGSSGICVEALPSLYYAFHTSLGNQQLRSLSKREKLAHLISPDADGLHITSTKAFAYVRLQERRRWQWFRFRRTLWLHDVLFWPNPLLSGKQKRSNPVWSRASQNVPQKLIGMWHQIPLHPPL